MKTCGSTWTCFNRDFPRRPKKQHCLCVLPIFWRINVSIKQNNMFFSPLCPHFYPFLGSYSCLTISLTSTSLLHLPLLPVVIYGPGMCRAGQRARALVMCGCRRPLLRLHQQTSQIIIASPRSRRGAVTLNHGQGDERETGWVCWDGWGLRMCNRVGVC